MCTAIIYLDSSRLHRIVLTLTLMYNDMMEVANLIHIIIIIIITSDLFFP